MKLRTAIITVAAIGAGLALTMSASAGKGGGAGRGKGGGWQQGGTCTNVCPQGGGVRQRLRDGSCTNQNGQVTGPIRQRLRDGSCQKQ